MSPRPIDVEETTHRGVRWQRASNGAMRWHDDEAGEWVRYRPRRDAPPLPPGWEGRHGLIPVGGLEVRRPSWRSPYRIVPIVLIVAVIVIGVVQATHGSGGEAASEAKAADALVGRCLAVAGSSGGRPTYSPDPVACGGQGALVKVVKVLPGTPGAPSCAEGTTPVVLAFPGVRYPHQLCTVVSGP